MIVDTHALSAIADAEAGVRDVVESAEIIAIPVVVLGEYRFGIIQSRWRAEYEKWLEDHLPACLVLEVTAETAATYAEVRLELKRAGTPLPVNDTWIAALCRQYRLPILSRDEHFDLVKGVRRLSW